MWHGSLLMAFAGVGLLAGVAAAQLPKPPPKYGPWHRDLYVHESGDGLTFGPARVFVERAGVPSVAVDAKGRLVAAFQWFPFDRPDAFDRVAVALSDDDGKTWGKPQPVEVQGLPAGYERPYDPTVVLLDDGRLRLYFTSREGPRGRQAIYSAVSEDGIRYTFEPGMRFGVEDGERRAYDCAVARLGKTWHLYCPVPGQPGRGYHAVSEDGLTFRRVEDVRLRVPGEWLGNVIAHRDGLRFYGSGREGMWVAFSKDGAAWELEAPGGHRGGDPGVARTKAGRFLRIYTGGVREDADRVQPPFRPAPQGAFPLPPPQPRPKRPPNVLWIVGENIALDLGCYGEKLVRTPHLDRLAAEGVRYTRAYATAPVCSASRSAFMTGMYQTSIGAHNARSHRDDGFKLPGGVRPLTHWLRDAGYFTANVKAIDGRVVGTGKVDLNFTWEGQLFDSDSWADLKARQPFYAQVNTPEVEYDIYDRKSAAKPRVEWVGEREHPQVATPENVTPPPYYPDHPVTRQEWARYLNSVSGMDRRVGVVLDKLKADGLLEDTVVIFFADNGRLEARGIHWCSDSGLHVPLIIRWPKNYPAPPLYQPGTVDERVVSLLDLTATTLSLARVPKPEGMQSRVFFGRNTEPTPRVYAVAARDRIDETVQRIRSVHDRRYHYVRNYMPERPFTALNRYKEKCFLVMPLMRRLHAEGKLTPVQAALMAPRLPDEELYDLKADPHEVRNLVGSATPAHRDALRRLRAELDRWVEETKDQGAVPEPPEVIAPFEKEMHDWFGTPEWAKRGR